MKAAACPTEILVRLWTRTGEGKKLLPDEASAKREGAIAFIHDVIASKKGVLASAEDGLFVSVLHSPADALVASRQILLGMRGFQERSDDHPVSVSISIDTSLQNSDAGELPTAVSLETTEAGSEPTHQASPDLSSLIRISRPAQVLLTHDLFQQIGPFKGLPMRPFQGRFGVFEYLWTSEDKLLEFQNQQSGFVDLVEVERTETPVAQAEPALPSSASETYFEPRARTPFDSADAQLPAWRRAIRTPWIIATVATLVAALVITGGIALRGKKTAPIARSAPANHVTVPATPVPPPATLPQTPHSTKAAGHQSAKQTTADLAEKAKPVRPEREQLRKSETPAAAAVTVPAPATTPKSACSLPGDLQTFVRVAEGYRGKGQYQDAKRLFSRILDCDPSNQDARNGLARTQAAEAASPQ